MTFDCNRTVDYNKLRTEGKDIPDSELLPWVPIPEGTFQVGSIINGPQSQYLPFLKKKVE